MSKTATTKELRIQLCQAGRVAATELITVAEMSIFASRTDDGVTNDDLGAEKMKIAAQAKKVAIMDGFEILTKVDEEERKMKEEEENLKEPSEKAESKERNLDVSVERKK